MERKIEVWGEGGEGGGGGVGGEKSNHTLQDTFY